MTNNLYAKLHGFGSNCDEDFLTEGFAHLLRELQVTAPNEFAELITNVIGGCPDGGSWNPREIEVLTQVVTDFGIPDIVITAPRFLALIEVKVDSWFEETQLTRYRGFLQSKLQAKKVDNARLLTLTRNSVDETHVDRSLRWNALGDFLDDLFLADPVARYLRNEYVEFLKIRGVMMTNVGYELVPGIQSLQALMTMIEEALAQLDIKTDASTAGRTWHGFRKKGVGPEGESIFIGYKFDSPAKVWVYTEYCNFPESATCQLGEFVDNFNRWQRMLDLSSEDTYFFSRSKDSQLECLKSFLGESIRLAQELIHKHISCAQR